MGAFRGAILSVGVGIIVWLALIAGCVAAAPEASSSPLCEVRSEAHIAKHGGLLKDSAEHVARGELPTCDPNPQARERKGDNEPDERKSRHCRKKWYC